MTAPTVVNLDLCKMCEERVGPKSFLTDLPGALQFVPAYYIPFGVGTIVEILYEYSKKVKVWEKGIIITDKGERKYSIYFTDGQTVEWTLNDNQDKTATSSKDGQASWKLSDSLYDLEQKKTEALAKIGTATTAVAAANKGLADATTAVAAANKGLADATTAVAAAQAAATTVAERNTVINTATKPAKAILKQSNSDLLKATDILSQANKRIDDIQTELSSIDADIKEYYILIAKIPLTVQTAQINPDLLNRILTDINKSVIFYGLFRILMACDVIHDFLGSRGFNNCQNFKGDDQTPADIKLTFRGGIVDAVIDSFVYLFSGTIISTPETLANVLLHVCLHIIEQNSLNINQKSNQKITIDKNFSLKQNLMNNLKSDEDAKKLSNIIIDAIGLKKVSGNIKRNDYKTGFPTIVDTHEAIDKYYNSTVPQYWQGDIACRVDAINDRNHFIPIVIGLWNSANISLSNELNGTDKQLLETAIGTVVSNNVNYSNIYKVRDVYSTFRKINIERDLSTNFDASFVDSLTSTYKCLTAADCKKDYDTIFFNITCGITLVSGTHVIQVPILNCSLTAEPEDTFNGRPNSYKDTVTDKNIPKKRKIELDVTNYFGAVPAGGSKLFSNINDKQQLMGVNKITLEMCNNQTNIVQQAWTKTLGDFLQIMTYLGIPKSQAKMFVTLDIIAGNIASLFDKFVFLENVGKKRYVADVEDEPEPDDDLMVGQAVVAPVAVSSASDLVKLFELTYGGTYIYIPNKMTPEPEKMTEVKIMADEQREGVIDIILNRPPNQTSSYKTSSSSSYKRSRAEFGTISKSNFGKKIKAAIIQARAYLKKNQFGKKTINMIPVNELRTKLNSVGIKTYVLKSGKKVNLSLRQLQSAANYFKKLQIRCKNAGIKLMYNRNGKYYYKSYIRLVNESRKIGKIGKSGKSGKSNKINEMDVNELRTRLNSVGIKTYVLKSGKKVNLPLIQLQRAANYFKKLQIRCKNAGIKLMYKRNGKYYYKSYTRLMSETKRNKFG